MQNLEDYYTGKIENLCEAHMAELCHKNPDPSHDLLHVKRVVRLAKAIAQSEKADLNVVVPAAYLHDCVYISKADPRRKQASRLSAEKAVSLLESWHYPNSYFEPIYHA